jgi:RimJ/RimL family protein N-acetyltransferase
MRYYKKLEGERVYLSPITPEDAETYTAWLNNLETSLNLTLAPQVISETKEREILEKMSREGGHFAVVRQDDDTILGNCGLLGLDQIHRTTEIGIFIGETEHRGQGYGAEAIELLLDYCFNLLNLHSVMLRVRSFNSQGIACYRKVGFREIGRRRESCMIGGRWYDEVFMDILAEEFSGGRIRQMMDRKEEGQ